MEERCPLHRQPEEHHFWLLIMLAVTAGAFLLVVWVPTKALFVSAPLKTDWQTHVLASSGYLELGMFDDAAMVGARVNLYMAAKKWDMAAAVASHLAKGSA